MTKKTSDTNVPKTESKNIEYYFEDGMMVMTEAYHLRRGTCCGMKCRHCPFEHKNVVDTEK